MNNGRGLSMPPRSPPRGQTLGALCRSVTSVPTDYELVISPATNAAYNSHGNAFLVGTGGAGFQAAFNSQISDVSMNNVICVF